MSESLESLTREVEHRSRFLHEVQAELSKVIVGQRYMLDRLMIGLLTGGHILLEGVPGLAKTTAVKALAGTLQTEFGRIQFTPDLMPADITGTSVFNLQKNEFNLVKGPVFTSFLLADEINRAPAKTQSSLLQAMQERIVTIDRDDHILPENFTVFATQNPVEYEGTYPLPEAQKDRFMLKIYMDYPEADEEYLLADKILHKATAPDNVLGQVNKILTPELIGRVREIMEDLTIKEELVRYAVDLIRATRDLESILVGAGPRATQALLLSSRAHATLCGRDFVTPDDIKSMLSAVLDHRIILRPEYEIEGLTVDAVLQEITQSIAVPR